MQKSAPNMPSSSEICGIAAVTMPYGSPVKLNAAGSFVPARLELNSVGNPVPGAADDQLAMVGVLRRPARTENFSHCVPGDEVRVKGDGGIIAVVDDRPVWLELRNGQPIERL